NHRSTIGNWLYKGVLIPVSKTGVSPLLNEWGFLHYPSVLIMLEIESNNWLSTSENIFLPPLFSFTST
ncbi:hypothetical protein VSS76_08985, partial [Bacillus safensis]|nr:hypothetical protein [Bacillus safensis]MEC4627416.1 hypothetical protein [Bacillus safensis]